MNTSEIERPHLGPPLRHRHPLMIALRARGVTTVDEARSIHRSVASLRSFCAPATSAAYRPIPRAIAQRWEKTYGVPMSTWQRVAD